MDLDNDITIHNIAEQLKHRLVGTFVWPLLQELERRLSAASKSTKDVVNINKWFKDELERLVDSSDENSDPRTIMIAQSLLDLVDMKSDFASKSEEEIIIHTATYVKDEVFQIKKGAETDNKDTFTLDVLNSTPQYRCHNATAALVEDSINDKIIRFSNLFKEFCASKGLNCAIKPIRTSSDVDATIYGRIGSEDEAFIDDLNVTLQGSTTNDFGIKVQVQNLQQFEEICVFPGQMAAVTGRYFEDTFGIRYVTSNIRCGIPVDAPVSTLTAQNKFKKDNIHIMVIKGALLTEKLEQTNFLHVYHKLKRDKPHVVIFTGPFVSVNQVAVEGQNLSSLGDLTFLYRKFLMDLSNVAQFGPMKFTKFIIVPHCYDVLLSYPLPQPPLNCPSSPLSNATFPENIIFLSNPGTIKLNGLLLYITSCDPLTGIAKNMVCRPKGSEERLICQQLLQQRSLFPGYPASRLPSEYAIDHSMLRQLEFSNDMVPDLILFSSALKSEPFIQFTNSRAFISCYSSASAPKNSLVQSVTEIYITPQATEAQVEGPVQPIHIDKRISLSVSILK